MRSRALRSFLFTSVICVLVVLVWANQPPPGPPVAFIQVVDATCKPVPGAMIKPDGLRPKSGTYSSGHYMWMTALNGVANDAVKTGADGYARVPYPKYVFERIERGLLGSLNALSLLRSLS